MDELYLSIVVPCYNEDENLRHGVLDEMHAYLSQQSYAFEVIVSDDGSTDDSVSQVRAFCESHPRFKLVENVHAGKPSAVWNGIQRARGEIVLFTDMDQSTPLNQVDRLLARFDAGLRVAIGSRGFERENFPLHRKLGSAAFRAFRQLILLRGISDTQCGFKAMRRDVALALFPELEAIRRSGPVTGWRVTAFDVELLYLAQRAGYGIAEVQVDWADRDEAKGKRKSYLAESREMAAQILRVKLNDWRGLYDHIKP